uniref:RING-type domain-containing protein n=1 Tax=Glossina brevipalpis TaxID=37001 RepID=A0A1A9WAL8_9MUSC
MCSPNNSNENNSNNSRTRRRTDDESLRRALRIVVYNIPLNYVPTSDFRGWDNLNSITASRSRNSQVNSDLNNHHIEGNNIANNSAVNRRNSSLSDINANRYSGNRSGNEFFMNSQRRGEQLRFRRFLQQRRPQRRQLTPHQLLTGSRQRGNVNRSTLEFNSSNPQRLLLVLQIEFRIPVLREIENRELSSGLTRDEINLLPSYTCDQNTHLNECSACVVCLCDFTLQQVLRVLPCGHIFHAQCVDRWLEMRRTCPICRTLCSRGPEL